MGVERAREALARLLLSDEALRGRLEAQWPYADKHLIAEAIETAVLDYLDNPSRFDAKQGKTLPNFLLLVASGAWPTLNGPSTGVGRSCRTRRSPRRPLNRY